MSNPREWQERLKGGSIQDRTAVVNAVVDDLDWDDIQPLIDLSLSDRSPAVRMAAAGAAADIAAHFRGAGGQPRMTRGQRAEVLDWLRPVNPETHPALLLLYAAVADKRAVDRLGRALRDPRNGVRAGAMAALRRLALSGASMSDDALVRAVASWIDSGRLTPDVMLELGRLIGECGWLGLDEHLSRIQGLGRVHPEVVEEARQRLSERTDPSCWQGLWVCDGRDVLEPGKDTPLAWMVVAEQTVVRSEGDPETLAWSNGLGELSGAPLRMVFAPYMGQETRRAIQVDGFTFWHWNADAIVARMDEAYGMLSALGPAAGSVADAVEDLEGAAARRAHAVVLTAVGRLDEAGALLEGMLNSKRPRHDLFYWLGVVRDEEGRGKEAGKLLEEYLEKAGKKAAYREDAEARIAALG